MKQFLSKVLAWLKTFMARKAKVEAEYKEREKDILLVTLAVKDAVKLSKGQSVNLFEVYEGLAAARRLYATREEFVTAVEHLIKG